MIASFNNEEMSDFKEAFSLFDQDGDGFISIKEMENLIKSIGINSNEYELKDVIDKVSPNNNNETFDFVVFLLIISHPHFKEKVEFDEKMNIFNAFDGQKIVSVSEFRFVLQNLGEKLSDEEIEEMIQEAKANENGEINYEEFVKSLLKK